MSLIEYKDKEDICNASTEELKVHVKNIRNMCKGRECRNCVYRVHCSSILEELNRKREKK